MKRLGLGGSMLLILGAAMTAPRHSDGTETPAPASPPAAASSLIYRLEPDSSAILAFTGSSGLFGRLGHEHTVRVPIFAGLVRIDTTDIERFAFEIEAPADSVRITDEGRDPGSRLKVEKDMKEKVLESHSFPAIVVSGREFMPARGGESAPAAIWGSHEGRLTVALELHGVEHRVDLPLRLDLDRARLRARGRFAIRHADFGMKRIKVTGVVNVAEEIAIEVDLVGFAIEAGGGPAGPGDPAIGGDSPAPGDPPARGDPSTRDDLEARLMVHVPFDGSFSDSTGLGAVRAEADGAPEFVGGVAGLAARPARDRPRIGELIVSRLARLVLWGHTPAAGTLAFWIEALPDGAAPAVVLSSGAPLDLEVEIGRAPPRVTATFHDGAGNPHPIEAPLGEAADGWRHIALGWDAARGAVTLLIGGEEAAAVESAPFEMPGLPRAFVLGAPGAALDDFRLYDRRLDSGTVRALPGFAPGR